MSKATPAAVAPRLPARSVDFNAFDKACKAGADHAADFVREARGLAKDEPLPPEPAVAVPALPASDD